MNSKCKLAAITAALLLMSGGAFAQAVGSASSSSVTTGECRKSWVLSSAEGSCTASGQLPYATTFSSRSTFNDACYVQANCNKVSGGTSESTFLGKPSEVGDLNNCDGTLKLGDC